MKKNLFESYEMITDICEMCMELDDIAAKSLICMLIDTTAAVHAEKATDIAEEVRNLVTQVNHDFGVYQIGGWGN